MKTTHFNKLIDNIQSTLNNKITDITINSTLFEENKKDYINFLRDQINSIESLRNIENYYVFTSKVKMSKKTTNKPVCVKPEDKITFGKYKGKTFNEIADIDSNYIIWLNENVKTMKLPIKFVDEVQIDVRQEKDVLAEYWHY